MNCLSYSCAIQNRYLLVKSFLIGCGVMTLVVRVTFLRFIFGIFVKSLKAKGKSVSSTLYVALVTFFAKTHNLKSYIQSINNVPASASDLVVFNADGCHSTCHQ